MKRIHFPLGLYNNKVRALGGGFKISNSKIEYDMLCSQASLECGCMFRHGRFRCYNRKLHALSTFWVSGRPTGRLALFGRNAQIQQSCKL